MDAERLNAAMLVEVAANLEGAGVALSPPVADAFAAVPRHLFVPDVPLEDAYRDQAIILKEEDGVARSSSSQPTIMAIMLEQLAVRPGARVLEIGTGSGYNAALLARLVGAGGHVVSVDLDEELVAAARERLAAAGAAGVEAVVGDGGFGWPAGAPYDAIVVTAAAWDVAPAWREQLAPGGRIVLPLAVRGAQVCAALAHEDGHLASVSIHDCGFMPLRGAFAVPPSVTLLEPGLLVEHGRAVDAGRLRAWLGGPWEERPTEVAVDMEHAWRLWQWLAFREPRFCTVRARGGHALLPRGFQLSASHPVSSLPGLIDDEGLALVAAPPQLVVRGYGAARVLAARLVELVRSWDAAGRPSGLPRWIRVFPPGAPLPEGVEIDERPSSVLAIEWE